MVNKTRSKMGRAARIKGKAFERTVANYLKSRGFTARRALQFDGSFAHDLDVNVPFNFECKAVEKLNIHEAMKQAVKDAQLANTTPVVVHKKSHRPPLVTMSLDDFTDLLQWAVGYVDASNALDLRDSIKEMEEQAEKEEGSDLL